MRDSIGRYRIVRKLGEGGMGAVYEALDASLDRPVAIKTIRSEVADRTARQRLRREARAAASVNHPRVCQIFEIGEDDGELYLVMELLEGEALSTLISNRCVDLRRALEMVIEILDAVEALHARGLVHRDLKPSNVFCTPYGIKLLDLGIVLPLEDLGADEGARLTRTGILVGTPSFMAPEQWAGSNVGPAADLFAIGAMLFELITGEPAFRGDSVLELYNAIARDPAPSLVGGPALEIVDRVVQRALAKQPADRPTSAAAMAAELRAALPLIHERDLARARHVRRLLVLPFRLLQPDEDIDFLGVSLADALVASLSTSDDLIVKRGSPRHAVADPDFSVIAREAHVGLTLCGTMQRAGPRLRVTSQLVEVPEGVVVWSETKQSSLDDIFAMQDELAGEIAASLTSRLGRRNAAAVPPDVPATGKAYEYYLRANQLSYNFGMLASARDLYEAAIEEDPRFAPAWARLGRVLRVTAKYGHGGEDGLTRAQEAFLRALSLNPHLALAHNYYAYYEIEELGRPEYAMLRLLDQTHRAPNDPELLAGLVVACRFCGLLDASVEADRRARRLDPSVVTSVAYTHWMRGDYEAAMRADDEDLGWIHSYSLPMLDRIEEAIARCRRREARSMDGIERDMLVANRAALELDRGTCTAAARRVFDSCFHDPEGLYYQARNATRVGDVELGFEIMERVVERGLSCAETFARDPWLHPMRTEDRFASLLARAHERHVEACEHFVAGGGERLLGSLPTIATR